MYERLSSLPAEKNKYTYTLKGNFGSEVSVILKVTFDLQQKYKVNKYMWNLKWHQNYKRWKIGGKDTRIMETFSHTCLAVLSSMKPKWKRIRRFSQVFKEEAWEWVEQNFVRHFRKKLFPVFRDDFNFIVIIKSVFKHD